MPRGSSKRRGPATTTVSEAQAAIAALIPKLEKLAKRSFVIASQLDADLDDAEMLDRKPGPDHLRWHTALGAMAIHSELMDITSLAQANAERTDADLFERWQREQKLVEEYRARLHAPQPEGEPGASTSRIGRIAQMVHELAQLLASSDQNEPAPKDGQYPVAELLSPGAPPAPR